MSDAGFWLNCVHCGVSYRVHAGHIVRPTRCKACASPICDACDHRARQAGYDHERNRMGDQPGARELVNHTLLMTEGVRDG